ncbi:MAG: M24 family metallopeptidase [Thermoleophilaceae bacterium]
MRSDRLRELAQARGAGAVLLRRVQNFAWFTGGGDTRVDHANPLGVADVVVTPDSEYVLTSTIEAPRMRAEQAVGFEVVEYPWHEGPETVLRELTGGALVASDVGDGLNIADEVARLRRVLDRDARGQLRAVGADAVRALHDAADAIEPGVSEHDAAAELAAALRRRNLAPHVLLAAADERIARHRHPLPFGARVERRVMLVTSAERHGLYANVTLIRDFEEPDPDTARRMRACDEVLARTRDEATIAGQTLAQVFDRIRSFYAEVGFPDEWRLHHQGGMTGYASREVIATPATDDRIEPGQAFAWNPSITGAKAEETFLLTEDGPEVVTPRTPAVSPQPS